MFLLSNSKPTFAKRGKAMPLRFDLGPFEQLFIGKCVLTNSRARAFFTIEGQLPILQGKDVLPAELAVSPLEKLYCCVQQMYLDESHEEHQGSYLALADRSLTENPTLASELQAADQLIASRQHYKALKVLKKLMDPVAFTGDGSASADTIPRRSAVKKAL
jgi:flagellar biosynthesis repressor protein FlbT